MQNVDWNQLQHQNPPIVILPSDDNFDDKITSLRPSVDSEQAVDFQDKFRGFSYIAKESSLL